MRRSACGPEPHARLGQASRSGERLHQVPRSGRRARSYHDALRTDRGADGSACADPSAAGIAPYDCPRRRTSVECSPSHSRSGRHPPRSVLMGSLRMRRRVKLAPGLSVNINKNSISLTAGVPGAHKTISSNGRETTTVGLPGTGLSYVDVKKRKVGSPPLGRRRASNLNPRSMPAPAGGAVAFPPPPMFALGKGCPPSRPWIRWVRNDLHRAVAPPKDAWGIVLSDASIEMRLGQRYVVGGAGLICPVDAEVDVDRFPYSFVRLATSRGTLRGRSDLWGFWFGMGDIWQMTSAVDHQFVAAWAALEFCEACRTADESGGGPIDWSPPQRRSAGTRQIGVRPWRMPPAAVDLINATPFA